MAKVLKKNDNFHKIVFYACLITSIGLIVGGFFVPPLGIIDGSVITSVGELLAFATVALIPSFASKSTKVVTRSGTSIIMKAKDEQEGKEETDEKND